MKLKRNFYTQPTLKVAKALLGKYIIRVLDKQNDTAFLRIYPRFDPRESAYPNEVRVGKIVETEAYIGPQDRASHSYLGKRTPRNQAEYLIGGHIYIYLVYGMYWQLNISTSAEDKPECVLIRALEPVSIYYSSEASSLSRSRVEKSRFSTRFARSKNKKNLTNGPGKLCRYLRLDKSFYGEDLTKSKRIWLENRGEKIRPSQIVATKRIGIDYAGHYWASRKWRFYIRDSEFVSTPR